MEKILEEYYTYKDSLTLIEYIYGLIQAARCWFKEYIKKTKLKLGLKKCNTDPCLLYIVNQLRTVLSLYT